MATRLALAVTAAALSVIGIVVGVHHMNRDPSPRSQGYRLLGTVQGEQVWIRGYGRSQVAVLTTGKYGGICNASGWLQQPSQALCSDTDGTQSDFVQVIPAGTHPVVVTADGFTKVPTLLPYDHRYVVAVAFAADPSLFGAHLRIRE